MLDCESKLRHFRCSFICCLIIWFQRRKIVAYKAFQAERNIVTSKCFVSGVAIIAKDLRIRYAAAFLPKFGWRLVQEWAALLRIITAFDGQFDRNTFFAAEIEIIGDKNVFS